MKTQNTYIFLFLLLLISCNRKQGSHSNPIGIENRIVFFGPSQMEVDTSSEEGVNEAIDDFSFYISQSDSLLKSINIKTSFDTSFTILVNYGANERLVVDRKKSFAGYIFTNGIKKPLVVDEVMTDIDLIQTAKEYFEIK